MGMIQNVDDEARTETVLQLACVAELLAFAANENLQALSEAECGWIQRRLKRLADRNAAPLHRLNLLEEFVEDRASRTGKEGQKRPRDARAELEPLWEIARSVVAPLADGQRVSTRTLHAGEVEFWLQVSDHDGAVELRPDETTVSRLTFLERSILDLLRPAYSYPFKRCPHCTRIFVRRGRQRYCSPRCQSGAAESARAGSEKRRVQLRRAARRYAAKHRNQPDGGANS